MAHFLPQTRQTTKWPFQSNKTKRKQVQNITLFFNKIWISNLDFNSPPSAQKNETVGIFCSQFPLQPTQFISSKPNISFSKYTLIHFDTNPPKIKILISATQYHIWTQHPLFLKALLMKIIIAHPWPNIMLTLKVRHKTETFVKNLEFVILNFLHENSKNIPFCVFNTSSFVRTQNTTNRPRNHWKKTIGTSIRLGLPLRISKVWLPRNHRKHVCVTSDDNLLRGGDHHREILTRKYEAQACHE